MKIVKEKEKYNDIKIGDVIEAFGNVEVKRD